MIERRKSPRFKTKLLITVLYRDENEKIVTEESVFSEDIGIGGMRIVFSSQLPKEKVLDLKFFLFSDPIQLPARGKVVWSEKKQGLELGTREEKDGIKHELFWIGIQFIDIDPFTRERILRWIKKEFKTE